MAGAASERQVPNTATATIAAAMLAGSLRRLTRPSMPRPQNLKLIMRRMMKAPMAMMLTPAISAMCPRESVHISDM